MKKFICVLLALPLLFLAGCGCEENSEKSDKIQIIATLFPQYDFARIIGGDKVEVTLLLPPGSESHHYEPSPKDMTKIADSDLFIYTGANLEGWAGDIAQSMKDSVAILDVSSNIPLTSSTHNHDHALDPHIWLDFEKAGKMCENITSALCSLSPENEAYFKANLEDYLTLLTALDEKYTTLFASEIKKDFIFGDKFAAGYLVTRYSIPHQSAYSSCSANAEASQATIAALSDYVKDNDVKVVYCREFSAASVAKEIAKANNAEVLVIHSAHNISKEEREKGVTFISLMEQNLENLRKGLE